MPLLVDSPTELTTAATDFVLAIEAAICFALLHLSRIRSFRSRLWLALFATFALSALLGAVAHAIRMPQAINGLLWHPLYFLLGLVLTLLALIGLYDRFGELAARRWLPRLLPLPALVAVVTWLGGGAFVWFVLFEGAVMLFAIALYLGLVIRRTPGAGLILAGLAISIVAAIVQAAGPYTVEMFWLFDHNGIFHLVQMPGLLCFYLGARIETRKGGWHEDPEGDVPQFRQ